VKLTSRSEYALLALIYLARNQEGYIPVHTIAAAQQIPPKFLEQILLDLRRAKFLHSMKGKGGGYRLGKPAEQITLAEIIRLFDGALASTESASTHFYGPSPIEREGRLLSVIKELRDYVGWKMETTVLMDMV
jgi:Rrf2 family transcriptional regulator, cysteine metabolism repressor